MARHFKLIVLFALLLSQSKASAQFRLMRFDEDYSALKDTTRNAYQRLKFIPLSSSGEAYVSFGGSARAEYAYFENEDWGRLGIGNNDFLLQRYDLHSDWHLNKDIRLFAQLRSALQDGRSNGSRPIDEDRLNIQNLFIDFTFLKDSLNSATLRLGRQEIDYGSGRLISVREGPNARLYFTGGKIMLKHRNVSSDFFVMMADATHPGIFDNRPTKQLNLWGNYATIALQQSGNVDLYYIGIHRASAVYEQGTANENRHTVGGRFWRYGGGFIYNLEAAYQFGRFGADNITAWTASADIGYVFENTIFKPSINLRHDYISGDKNPLDGKLQTFNPIYPKGGYFGFSPQVGPVNLIDLHPYTTFELSPALKMQFDMVFNWRYALGDGVYRPSGSFNLAGNVSQKRYIGTAYLGSLAYVFSPFLSANIGAQYFKVGQFIDDIIPNAKEGLFLNARTSFKF